MLLHSDDLCGPVQLKQSLFVPRNSLRSVCEVILAHSEACDLPLGKKHIFMSFSGLFGTRGLVSGMTVSLLI